MLVDFNEKKAEIKIKKIIKEKTKKFENNQIRITQQEANLSKETFNEAIKKLIDENKIKKIEKDMYYII